MPTAATRSFARRSHWLAAMALLAPMLAGCFVRVRKLPVPQAPEVTQTVSSKALVAMLDDRWNALQSLTATVDIQYSQTRAKEGVAKDYTSFRGYIMMRKPEDLRVVGLTPIVRTPMFDMGSDGKRFTLVITPLNKAIEGPNSVTKKSAKWYENLRPGFFLDAMVVRGVAKDELYSVTAETVTEEDPERKHLLERPEYVVNLFRRKAGSQELLPVRVVRLHRDDLLPYEQDIYDEEGNLATQALYGPYADFGKSRYPSTVTIKRPLDELQLVLTVDQVIENQPMSDAKFQVKVPEGTPVQKLD